MLDKCNQIINPSKKIYIFPLEILVLSAGVIGSFWRQSPISYFFNDIIPKFHPQHAIWVDWLLIGLAGRDRLIALLYFKEPWMAWNIFINMFIFFTDTYSGVDLLRSLIFRVPHCISLFQGLEPNFYFLEVFCIIFVKRDSQIWINFRTYKRYYSFLH